MLCDRCGDRAATTRDAICDECAWEIVIEADK